MYLNTSIQNSLKMAHWFLRKSIYSFFICQSPWARSRIDLNLEYSYTFIHSISFLHLSTFKSRAAIIHEKKQQYCHFSLYKSLFDSVIKQVKVNPRSSFVHTMIGRSPKCYIPSFIEIWPLVP